MIKLNNTPHTSMPKRICASVGLLLFAWLITTNQTSLIRDNQDGTYTVEHKQYCTEVEPSYKANDLLIKNGEKEVTLRIDQYTVEKVANCP